MTTNINKQTYLGERGKANILLSSTVDGVFSITLEDDGVSWEMAMCRNDAMKIARKFAEMSGIIPVERKGEWISVKDKLPDKEGRCLVFTDYGDVTMDSFVDGMFVCNLGNVTHWRPLPKAPESEA